MIDRHAVKQMLEAGVNGPDTECDRPLALSVVTHFRVLIERGLLRPLPAAWGG